MVIKQLLTLILLFAPDVFAGPSGINLSGKISVQPSGSSLASGDVDFRIRVLSPNGCVLYTERFDNLDLASTNGSFNLTIGNGAAVFNAWDATPATRNSKASLLKLFSNSSPAIASGLTPYGAGPCLAGAYTPTADDGRQVVIELDPTGAGTPGSFLALSPYHQIRAVPYAMLADMASDSEKLGGVNASLYAKTTDLAAAVPANETDPTVEAFAKTALPDCAATGKVLTANAAGVLSCVAGGAGSYTLPAATAAALGGVIVGSGLSVAVDGTVSVSNTLTTDITNLQTAVGNKVDKASMAVCATNQVLTWQSPGDNFLCSNILITASQVSDFNTSVDARIAAGGAASPKLPLAGGTMTGSITMTGAGLVINMGNNNLANVSYLHLENKAADPVFSAGNNGYVWYNSTDKAIKFNDGVAIRSLAVSGAGGAPTGAAGGDLAGTYPNPTLKATGTAGTYVKVTTDAEGRVISGTVLAAADIPGLDAAKIITGQFGDARISDVGVDKITSGASKYFTYAPNNVACNTGEVLKKTTNGWECGADAGAGGADASSIRGVTVDNGATASIGKFMQHDGTKWTFVSMPVCTANKVLTFNASGIASCTDIAGLADANIAAGAAIARTKLASGSNNHVLINDGSGVMSSEAQLSVTRGGTGQSTYTNGQLLIGKTDGTLAKATLTAGSGVTVTNGDGTITIASSGTAAPTGAAGGDLAGTYPNPTLKATGTAGTYAKVTTDAEGRVTVGAALVATDIPALDAAKITTGQFADAQLAGISVDKVTSGASKYFTYAPNNVACANGEVLKKTGNGWECGVDAGAGGSDAISIRSVAVDGVATAGQGNFMQHDGVKWTFVSMPVCTADKVITFSVAGIATCTSIGGLVDSQIAAGAAIARTKLANGTANHVLINNGSGVMTSEAQLSVTRGGTGQSTYTDGQILIGKTDGTLAKATIAAGAGVSVTNGDGTITIATTGGGAPSGAAGGDLAGTYPNPTLKATGTAGTYTKVTTDAEGRVTVGAALAATDIPALDAAKITTGQFADARISDLGVDKITSGVGKYFTYKPNNAACAAGEFLAWNNSRWECTPAPAAGTDTLAALSCASGNVPSYNGAAWVCVGTGNTNVASTIVKRSAAGAISAGIADFTGVKLFDGSSGYVTLQTPVTVASYSLTLPGNTGTNGQFLTTNGSGVLNWTTASASLPALTNGSFWMGDGSSVATAVAMSGDATMTNAGAISVGTGKITSTHILDGTIANADINAAAAIARTKIANGTPYGIVLNNASGTMTDLACSTSGHVLAWNGTQFACAAPTAALPGLTSAFIWVGNGSAVATAVSPSGDVTMTNAGVFKTTKIQNISVSATAPTTDQVLVYNGTAWTPTSPTTTGLSSKIQQLDASGIATSFGVAIKGTTLGTATILAPTSFTSYTLRLPSSTGSASQVLSTDGSGTLSWSNANGSPTITTKTANFTVLTGEDNYFYMISNATTATLPSVGSVAAGFRVTFKRIGGSNVNVVASGAETIDGATQRALQSTYQTMALINTGTEWAIIGGGAVATAGGCVPGSQLYNSTGTFSFAVDSDKATKCTFTITVQGGGGGSVASEGAGGRGGAVRITYTAPSAGDLAILVGGAGAASGVGGYGGGGVGGTGSTKGAGGGGASAIRFTTSAPLDVLLAVAGGGGAGGAYGIANDGGDGGSSGGGANGTTTGTVEFGRGGINNAGGAPGTGTTNGGTGGSSGTNGTVGAGTYGGAGGTAQAAFSVSGGGGGSGTINNGAGAGGGGYGGGGGAAQGSSNLGGGGGGGGYVNPAVGFSSLTGPAAGATGSVLVEWN